MKKIIKKILRESFSSLVFYSGIYLLRLYFSKKKITILNYHDITSSDFERHVKYLTKRFNIITLRQCIDNLKSESIEKHGLAITFDDGYQSFYHDIFPILKKYSVPAAVFLTTDHIDSREIFWFDALKIHFHENGPKLFEDILGIKENSFDSIISYINRLDENEKTRKIEAMLKEIKIESSGKSRDYEILTWSQINEMKGNLVSFGAHTVTHPTLSRIPAENAEAEILQSKKILEERLAMPIEFFAYPFGSESDFNDKTAELVRKAGFISALTTVNGDCNTGDDLFRLNRKVVDGGFTIPSLAAKIAGLWIPLTRKGL